MTVSMVDVTAGTLILGLFGYGNTFPPTGSQKVFLFTAVKIKGNQGLGGPKKQKSYIIPQILLWSIIFSYYL